MANLFVTFTPLQVVVAQQIIQQEGLLENVMLESPMGNFFEIYRLIKNDILWKRVLSFENWITWDESGQSLLRNSFKVKRKSLIIKRLLEENTIDTIYLADFQNQTNRFTCVWLARLGYKVVFYEEGYSHYIPRVGYPPSNSIFHRIYERLLDWCYYLPLYGIRFAKWRCYPNKDYHGLPISTRYSIIPDVHHEPYDKVLKYEPMASPELQNYINEELGNSDDKKILLLTDPMTEVLPTQYKYLYFEIIREAIINYKDKHIYIKYHPRDTKEDRDEIVTIMEDGGCKFSILGERVNLPVEFYLQQARFYEVLFFNTSTYFYNGYLFPKTNFVKLLPVLYKRCLEHKAPYLRQMELILENL